MFFDALSVACNIAILACYKFIIAINDTYAINKSNKKRYLGMTRYMQGNFTNRVLSLTCGL